MRTREAPSDCRTAVSRCRATLRRQHQVGDVGRDDQDGEQRDDREEREEGRHDRRDDASGRRCVTHDADRMTFGGRVDEAKPRFDAWRTPLALLRRAGRAPDGPSNRPRACCDRRQSAARYPASTLARRRAAAARDPRARRASCRGTAGGATPTIVAGMPFTSMSRPMTSAVAVEVVLPRPSLMIAVRPGCTKRLCIGAGSNARPRAIDTPTVSK